MKVFGTLLLIGLGLQAAIADDVVVGTGKNFESLIRDNDFVVAEFYAPWCGHCKSLEPEYAKAAKQLKSHDPPILLVKVDATEEDNKELAKKYEVQGFPTLKIFRGGDLAGPQEYKGPRDADGIVKYLQKKLQPASKLLATDAEVEQFKTEDPAVVGIFSAASGADFDNFLAVASKLSDDHDFGHTTLDSALDKGETAPSVKIFKKKEGKTVVYTGSFDVEKLRAWIETNSLPLLIDLDDNPKNREAVQKAFASSGPRFFTFFEKDSKADKDLRPALNKLAETLIGDTYFINIDPSSNQHALDFFGVKKEDTPAFVIQSGKAKYVSSNVKAKQLQTFWDSFKAGTLAKSVKSEAPPAKNDKPVTVVTGNTLEEIAFSGKNVLVEFYAPWCGHCKKLEPVYEKVGKHFESNKSVVIAKMDATANDVTNEKFEVSGFPTLYFVSSSGDVSLFDGERTEEKLIAFVEGKSSSQQASAGSVDDHSEL